MLVRPSIVLALGLSLSPSFVQAQTRQIGLRGRVLEKANLSPVPGATVKLVGSALTAVTNAKGEFTLSGSSALRPWRAASGPAPWFQGASLMIQAGAGAAGERVDIERFDASGNRLAAQAFRLEHAGLNKLDVYSRTRGNPVEFVRVRTALGAFLFKVVSDPAVRMAVVYPSEAGFGSAVPEGKAGAAAKTTAASQLEVGADLLLTKTSEFASDTGNVGDIVLDYPPRKLDVGAPPIYGAVVLFGGNGDSAAARAELESKWVHWINPWRASKGLGATPVLWKIRPDPEEPANANRRTISPCCLPRDGSPDWGYDDLLSKQRFRDFQLHLEFNMYGGPNDAAPGAYTNSGAYLQNRYEIQIETEPTPWDPRNNHGIASIINEFPPDKNMIRPPGKWQAYDITFRASRWNGNTLLEKARMTIFWNGTLVHGNRESAGPLANPGSGGANIDSTAQGLKLQNEKGLDVRFRNIWIKELNLVKAETNFGY